MRRSTKRNKTKRRSVSSRKYRGSSSNRQRKIRPGSGTSRGGCSRPFQPKPKRPRQRRRQQAMNLQPKRPRQRRRRSTRRQKTKVTKKERSAKKERQKRRMTPQIKRPRWTRVGYELASGQ